MKTPLPIPTATATASSLVLLRLRGYRGTTCRMGLCRPRHPSASSSGRSRSSTSRSCSSIGPRSPALVLRDGPGHNLPLHGLQTAEGARMPRADGLLTPMNGTADRCRRPTSYQLHPRRPRGQCQPHGRWGHCRRRQREHSPRRRDEPHDGPGVLVQDNVTKRSRSYGRDVIQGRQLPHILGEDRLGLDRRGELDLGPIDNRHCP